jgi:hypothetical protein
MWDLGEVNVTPIFSSKSCTQQEKTGDFSNFFSMIYFDFYV